MFCFPRPITHCSWCGFIKKQGTLHLLFIELHCLFPLDIKLQLYDSRSTLILYALTVVLPSLPCFASHSFINHHIYCSFWYYYHLPNLPYLFILKDDNVMTFKKRPHTLDWRIFNTQLVTLPRRRRRMLFKEQRPFIC